MARRCKTKQRRGGFFITVPMILSAGEGVKAIIDATKHPPPAPVVRARGLNFRKKHKKSLSLVIGEEKKVD